MVHNIKIMKLITEDLKTWKVELTAEEISLAVVKIQRITFQGYTLSICHSKDATCVIGV